MAIEWETRIGKPITLGQGARAAAEIAAELLRLDSEVTVEVTDAELSYVWEPVVASPRESAYAIFRLPEWEAVSRVSLTEEIPFDDADSGSGLFAGVESARDNASQILSIATVCALAQLGGGTVEDGSRYLGDATEQSPAEIIARLKLDAPAGSLAAAMDAVLGRTKLRNYG
jgi:hypothetical protein